MLDTETVSLALRGEGGIGARILEHRPSQICLSSITVGELRYGAVRGNSPRLQELIDSFIINLPVLPFDETCAAQYGILAAELNARRTAVDDFDVLIAAHAIAVEATLVTRNVKSFARIRLLKVESWL
jgi:tRNA(fMet)-specific endonuclease VapC